MLLLNTLEDEFPPSPSDSIDSRRYYESFLKAEAILAGTPKQYHATRDERLPELTSFLYRGGDTAGALYRKRDDASQIFTNLWLSAVRHNAAWFNAINNVPSFGGLDKSVLAEIPKIFRQADSLDDIAPYLANYGIILIYEPSIPSMKLDGAIFALPSKQVVIALSLRYSRLDHYWFTLMHELAHAVLHADQLENPILDNFEDEFDSVVEKQADRLASDCLIPRNEWRSCPARYTLAAKDVLQFAEKLGIPPQVVAGRLRRDTGKYDIFNDIINEYNVRDIINGTKP
jgi:HTH-type transcriptional regulator/antitoxin HigA